jgi:uncharacterized membrane protein
MISGLGSRVSDLEKSIRDLKDKIMSLDRLIRHDGTETADSPIFAFPEPPARWTGARVRTAHSPSFVSSEPPVPEYKREERAEEETSLPDESRAAPPEIPSIPEETERLNEQLHETPAPTVIPPPLPEVPKAYVPAYAEPSLAEWPEPVTVKPSWLAERCRALLSWLLTEGNIWVTVGVMLFLAGFGLLFSYVHRMGWISLELRLTGTAVAGIAMTALGWRLRELRRTYALILQGGGIGVLYIVLVAGTKFGPVIPVGGAVVGMLLLSAFTIVMALYQEFEPLALFALLGGYAAPILVNVGSQNFVALFSIHSLLNFETFLLSLFRDWRKTRWGGLLASFATGVAWGALRWRASYFASVEPFLILF